MGKALFLKEGRLRPTWRVILYLCAYFLGQLLIQVPVGLVYGAYLFLAGLEFDESAAIAGRLPLPFLVATSLVAFLAALLVTWLFRRFLDGASLLDLGLHRGKRWRREIVLGLALGFLLMAFIFALEWAGGWLEVLGLSSPSLLPLAGMLAGYGLSFAFVSWAEELAFRGYILQNLRREWGNLGAALASSFIFALFHGLNPNFTPLALLGIALAGILLSYGYLLTGSLWLPIALHFAWNFAQGPLFSFPVSGLPSGGLLAVRVKEAYPLLTGGPFGPEGGLVGLASLLLGLLLLRLWWRRKPG